MFVFCHPSVYTTEISTWPCFHTNDAAFPVPSRITPQHTCRVSFFFHIDSATPPFLTLHQEVRVLKLKHRFRVNMMCSTPVVELVVGMYAHVCASTRRAD